MIDVLGGFTTEPGVASVIINALTDPAGQVRAAAVSGYEVVIHGSSDMIGNGEVIHRTIQFLDDPVAEVRANACYALKPHGYTYEILEALVDATYDPEKIVRIVALDVLARVADKDIVIDIAIRMLDDKELHVVQNAMSALGDMGPLASRAIPRLEEFTDWEENNYRLMAIDTIKYISAELE